MLSSPIIWKFLKIHLQITLNFKTRSLQVFFVHILFSCQGDQFTYLFINIFSIFLNFCYLFSDATTEVWKVEGPFTYAKTQRGRNMLVFQGYKYVENRQSAKHTFWRCARYVKHSCRATVVTSKDLLDVTIRIAGSAHSHASEVPSDTCDDEKQ